jgi:3-oxoacyl-(acyl-carrier-protein) synthase
MLRQGAIAPIANCSVADPEFDLDLVTGSAREKPGMRSALLNSVGLFGEAASIIIRR